MTESALAAAYAALSPAKRALLALELAKRRAATVGAIPTLPRTGDGQTFPTSYAQERLWFADQLEPGSSSYVVPAGVRLRGHLDVAVLRASLDRVVARHEALRTTFPAPDGRPVQAVAANLPVGLPVTDLRALPAHLREPALTAAHLAEATRPFDLAAGPLVRASLLRLADDDQVLLLSLHHIVADGWSLGVLVRELGALYAGAAVADLSIQYADYASWQRDWLAGGVMDEQLGYWRDRLAGAPALHLPTDRPSSRDDDRRDDGCAVAVRLAPDLIAVVSTVAERERATPYMVLLAAFALVLASYSGDSDLVVGTPVAGRHRAETEPLIGCFVNTLPLRVTLTPGLSFRELVDQVRRTCLDAYRHQDVPFERIVSVSRSDRAGAPLVRAMLALGNVPTPALELPGLTAMILDPPVRASKFDLNVELTPTADGGLSGRAEFTVDRYDEAAVARWMDSWREVLAAAVAAPDTDLARLPLPSPLAIPRPRTESVPVPTPARVYVAPAGPLEILLARMWTEVLQTDHIGAEDDFFALGGHSLLATQVRARIRATFGIELPLRGMLAVSTVRDLAGYLRELGREANLDVDGLAAGAGAATTSIRRLDRTQYRSVKPR